jgi:cytochrome c biogenesis protein CcdA
MALQVRPQERAGLFAAVFVIGYLAFGIPVVIAGQAADRIGLAQAVTAYVLVLIGVAVVGLLAESRHDVAHGAPSKSMKHAELAQEVTDV